MSGLIDTILQKRTERARRLQAARDAFAALTRDQREDFLAEVVALVESEAVGATEIAHPNRIDSPPYATNDHVALSPATGTAVLPSSAFPSAPPTGKYSDRAEAFILVHHEGVTIQQIADALGQERASCDGTVRRLARLRRSVEQRDAKWYPVRKLAGPGAPPQKRSLKTVVVDVLSAESPLAAFEVFERVRKELPEVKRTNVAAEIYRLKKDRKVVVKGAGERGDRYALSDD